MNKTFTLPAIASLFFALPAMAVTVHPDTPRGHFIPGKQMPSGEISLNGHTFKIASVSDSRLKAPAHAAETTPVIEEAPGVPKDYLKASGGYYSFGNFFPYQDYDQAAVINWDDDAAYFYNILSYKETFSYVQAVKDDNGRLVLYMDQTVAEEPEDGFSINLGLLKTVLWMGENPDYDEDGDPTALYIDFLYNQDYSSVSYTIGENGKLSLDIPEAPEDYPYPDDGREFIDPALYGFPDYALGFYYTDDLKWTGDCDIYQEYEEFNYELITMPEGVETHTYSYISIAGDGVIVNVAQTPDALYFKDLSPYAPNTVVKANLIETEEGLIASVPQNEFIGKDFTGYYYLLTKTVNPTTEKILPDDVEATFYVELDPETGFVSSLTATSTTEALALNTAIDEYFPMDVLVGLNLKWQSSFAGTPSTPTGAYYEDHSKWLGANWLFFNLSPFAENGDIIDMSTLYYRVYVNGELFEFYEHDGVDLNGRFTTMYLGLDTPTTLIPYALNNGADIFSDEYRLFYVAFYTWDVNTVGVQAVYEYEGETTYSPVVTVEVDFNDVEMINTAEIADTEYFDLNGHKVANPDKGIYIKRITMTDGSVRTMKIILK